MCHSNVERQTADSPVSFIRYLELKFVINANVRVRSQVSACGICGSRIGTGTDFSPSLINITTVLHAPVSP